MNKKDYWSLEEEDRKEYITKKLEEALDINSYMSEEEILDRLKELENETDIQDNLQQDLQHYVKGQSKKSQMVKDIKEILVKKKTDEEEKEKQKNIVEKIETKKSYVIINSNVKINNTNARIERYFIKGKIIIKARDLKNGRFLKITK